MLQTPPPTGPIARLPDIQAAFAHIEEQYPPEVQKAYQNCCFQAQEKIEKPEDSLHSLLPPPENDPLSPSKQEELVLTPVPTAKEEAAFFSRTAPNHFG